ncbi:MAG: hypothetical protein U0K95_07780, partial [Eubacterium sp.]|nr:hypothetical protein [Eubacterium sp.]
MKRRILSLLMVFVVTVSLCSCGTPSPTDTVDKFLNGIKTQNNEEIKGIYADEEFEFANELDEEDGKELNKVLQEKMFPMLMDFQYTLSNEVIDGNKATVDVTVKTYNFGGAFTNFMSNYLTQAFALAFSDSNESKIDKLAANLLETELTDLTEKTYEETATITLTSTENGWVIDELEDDGEVMNVLTG